MGNTPIAGPPGTMDQYGPQYGSAVGKGYGLGLGGRGSKALGVVDAVLGGLRQGSLARQIQGYQEVERQYQVAKQTFDLISQQFSAHPSDANLKAAYEKAMNELQQSADALINYGGGKQGQKGAGGGRGGQKDTGGAGKIWQKVREILVGRSPFESGQSYPVATPTFPQQTGAATQDTDPLGIGITQTPITTGPGTQTMRNTGLGF